MSRDSTSDVVGALAKGLRVLECFRADHPRLSITDVANATGYDRATARRCLLTLVSQGYATHDGKYFALTARALRLGMGALAAMPLPQIVQPWLDQLSEQVSHSASVSILDGIEIVYLARASQRRVMSIGLMPGSRLPAYCTSMGRVLLAALPEAEARGIIDSSELRARTPQTLTDPDAIMTRIAEVRREGFAVIDQEVEMGLRSIAVPLESQRGKVVAAMNLGMAAVHASVDDMVADCLPKMRVVQEGLRRELT